MDEVDEGRAKTRRKRKGRWGGHPNMGMTKGEQMLGGGGKGNKKRGKRGWGKHALEMRNP